MKKLLLTISFIISGLSMALAQEVNLDSVNTGFRGMFTGGIDGQIYYTYYKIESPKSGTQLVLLSYTRELMPIKRTQIDIPRNSYIAASAFNGSVYFLVLADESKRSFTKLAVELDGKITKKVVEENQPAAFFTPALTPKVYCVMPDGFIVASHAMNGKIQGFKIEHLERNADSRWVKTYFPEKGSWSVVQCYPVMERLAVLRKEEKEGKKAETVYAIQTIQGDMGDPMFLSELTDTNNILKPTFFKAKEDFSITAGIMYKEDGKTIVGIFTGLLGPAGDLQKIVKIPLSKITEVLKGDILLSIAEGRSGLFIDDIIRSIDGYAVVAEIFTRTQNGKDANFTSEDFVAVLLDNEGNMTTASTHSKAPKQAIVKGPMAQADDQELAKWLADNHFFSYKIGSHLREQAAFVYQSEDTVSRLERISLRDTLARGGYLATLTRIKIPKTTSLVYDSNPNSSDVMKFPYTAVMHGRRESIMVYQYNRPKLVVWHEPNFVLQ